MVNTQSIPASAPAQDPISRDLTQISTSAPMIRRLTVSDGPRSLREPDGSSRSAPMLRLQGRWLEGAGFAVGVPVTVHVGSGRLIIEVAEPERVPQAEVLERIGLLIADEGLPKRDFHEIARRVRRTRRSD